MPDGPVVAVDFDAQIFGTPFFRVTDPAHPGLEAAWRSVVASQPEAWADARSGVEERHVHHRLGALGFRRICTQVTFAHTGPWPTVPEPGVGVAATLGLSDQELDEHAAAFDFTRFAQDPRMDRARADHWIRTWMANSLSGRREVVVLDGDFVTFRAGPAGTALEVDLVSVARSRQGRGHGGRLMRHLLHHAGTVGASEVLVTTEAENVPAQRLYSRSGFELRLARACFHAAPVQEEAT